MEMTENGVVELDLQYWGWYCKNGQNLSPITTDREVAPNQCGNQQINVEQTVVPAERMACLAS